MDFYPTNIDNKIYNEFEYYLILNEFKLNKSNNYYKYPISIIIDKEFVVIKDLIDNRNYQFNNDNNIILIEFVKYLVCNTILD